MFQTGFYYPESEEPYAQHQVFTPEHWAKLEALGAVFLPAAGSRYGSDVYDVQYSGRYWSATASSSNYSNYLYFRSDEADVTYDNRYTGRSVRLVKDLQ
jgi:uncharacterized protein (TIGR02145 family)